MPFGLVNIHTSMKNNCGKRQKLEDGTKTEMQTDQGSCDIHLAFFLGGGETKNVFYQLHKKKRSMIELKYQTCTIHSLFSIWVYLKISNDEIQLVELCKCNDIQLVKLCNCNDQKYISFFLYQVYKYGKMGASTRVNFYLT